MSLAPLQADTHEYRVPAPVVALWSDALILDLHTPRRLVSSAPFGGGLTRSRYLLNHSVPRDFCGDDINATIRAALVRYRLTGASATCALTAVDVTRYESESATENSVQATVYVTAGLGNLSAPGLSALALRAPGTINLFALVSADMPDAALVETMQIITEVKARCLAGRLTADGYAATGTSTDTVTVALLPGPFQAYAGAVTPVGRALARATDAALTHAFSKIT